MRTLSFALPCIFVCHLCDKHHKSVTFICKGSIRDIVIEESQSYYWQDWSIDRCGGGDGVALPGYVTACDEFTCFGVWSEMTEESCLSDSRRKIGTTRWAVGFKTWRSDILDLGWIYFSSIQPVSRVYSFGAGGFWSPQRFVIMRGLSAAILLLSILKGNGCSFWPHFGFLSLLQNGLSCLCCLEYKCRVLSLKFLTETHKTEMVSVTWHHCLFHTELIIFYFFFVEGPNTSPTVGEPDLLWMLLRFIKKKKMPSKLFPPHVFIYALSEMGPCHTALGIWCLVLRVIRSFFYPSWSFFFRKTHPSTFRDRSTQLVSFLQFSVWCLQFHSKLLPVSLSVTCFSGSVTLQRTLRLREPPSPTHTHTHFTPAKYFYAQHLAKKNPPPTSFWHLEKYWWF